MEPANVHHYHRAIIPLFVAFLALFGLFAVLAAPEPEPAAAQAEPPYYVVRGSSGTVPTCEEASAPYEYDESNCYDFEIPAWEATYETIQLYSNVRFCGLDPEPTYVRMYIDSETYINGYYPSMDIFATRRLGVDGIGFEGEYRFDYHQCSQLNPPALFYEGYITPYENSIIARINEGLAARSSYCQIGTGYAHVTVCINDSTPEEEPPPPADFCPDGFEVLSNTELIPANGTWEATAEIEWDKWWVRYAFTEPNSVGVLHRLVMDAQDETVTRQFYSDQVMEWDPETGGYLNEPWWFSVPNRHFPTYSDYDPTGYVTGTTAELAVTSGYNSINLVSACIIPHYGPSELCPDGIEALGSGPVYLDALNGRWETTMPMTYTHLVVRYSVENPMDLGSGGALNSPFEFMPQINYTYYYAEADMDAGASLTFTLPTTGVVSMYDSDSLFLRFINMSWPVILNSVCVVDASDYAAEMGLTEEECHLTNPDFVDELDGWSTQGTTSWNGFEENGAAELDSGQVYQAVQIDGGGVYQLQVRAKDNGGTTMNFGTSRTALINGGAQTDTVTLASYYGMHVNDIYVQPGDWILTESDGAIIDSVCLVDDGSLFMDMECTFPAWDPPGSDIITTTIYAFEWLGEVLRWVVCEISRVITAILDKMYNAFLNIFLRIPMIPEPGSGLISWVEWFGLLVNNLLDWFGINIPEIAEWFPRNFDEFVRWLNYMFQGFVFWLAEALGLDPYVVWDVIRLIWNEARLFWEEILIEVDIETDNALLLLQYVANVFITLANGVRSGVSGNNIAYIGRDFSGIGGFIWTGVNFVNEAVDMTPMSGLNIIALGVIAWGLLVWTGKKFTKILESMGS